MRIIAFRTLREFWEKAEYADSESSLRSWYFEAKSFNWKNANELKQQYKNACAGRASGPQLHAGSV